MRIQRCEKLECSTIVVEINRQQPTKWNKLDKTEKLKKSVVVHSLFVTKANYNDDDDDEKKTRKRAVVSIPLQIGDPMVAPSGEYV